MRRRSFLVLLATLSLPARAQTTARVHRIGYIVTATPDEQKHLTALRDGLAVLGYSEGRNYVFEARFAAGRVERLNSLAKELVDLKVDVIVTGGNPVVAAVQRGTKDIPIVMAASRDPVVSRFVQTLSHPGGNITGLTSDPAPEIFTKNVGLLKEMLPAASRIALLWNSRSPGANAYRKLALNAASELGLTLVSVEAFGRDEFEQAFATIVSERADGVVVLPDPLFFTARNQIALLAAKYKLPAVYHAKEFVEAGGLVSYGSNLVHQFRRASAFVDKILKGTKPTELPVEAATKFELVLNLKTARDVGVAMPSSLLARADEVIE
jgi:putative tryptophan/tyrosine transport system substrate-binding protein